MPLNIRFNRNLFVSLFQSDTSGTIVLELFRYKLEIDVKHASDYYAMNFHTWNTKYVKGCWLPIRFKCAGLRINFFTNYKP